MSRKTTRKKNLVHKGLILCLTPPPPSWRQCGWHWGAVFPRIPFPIPLWPGHFALLFGGLWDGGVRRPAAPQGWGAVPQVRGRDQGTAGHRSEFDNRNIVANIKILGIMLISQMIKGCKEKFFINQILDENIRRLHQGKKFFGKKCWKFG